jgi:predicted naringenin-chalcone synthase
MLLPVANSKDSAKPEIIARVISVSSRGVCRYAQDYELIQGFGSGAWVIRPHCGFPLGGLACRAGAHILVFFLHILLSIPASRQIPLSRELFYASSFV